MSANPAQPKATEIPEPSVIGSPLRALARLIPYALLTIVLLPVQAAAAPQRIVRVPM